MFTGWRLALVALALTLTLAVGLEPLRAADSLIAVSTATDLALPVAQLPPGFTLDPTKSRAYTDADLQPLFGKYLLATFHQSGLAAAYHGWLNVNAPVGAPFVTFELYGFKTINGARLARIAYQNLVTDTPDPNPDPSLPKSAAVWTNTGTFGPSNQPYALAEVVFRVANVVGDITGYYDGAGLPAINAALQQLTAATVAYVHWLSTRLPATHSVVPLLPLVVLPRAFVRTRRRERE